MKQKFFTNLCLFLFTFLSFPIPMQSHGFGQHTYVHLADDSVQEIGMLCRRALDTKVAIATYDVDIRSFATAFIKKCGCSKTNRYVQFALESVCGGISDDYIVCTPTQEFYLHMRRVWLPAYQLQIGDELLCKKGARKIAVYQYVQQECDVYTLEVSRTHTFFVGYHGALTHNMVLPAALGLGFSVPFGSATAGIAGSFFGPVTLVAGAVVGAVVGAFATMVMHDSVPSYKIDLGNAQYIDDFIQRKNATYHVHDDVSSTINQGSADLIVDAVFPMPDGPKKDDEKKRKRLSENKDDLKHIFRKAGNHFLENTPAIRKLIEDFVNDAANYLGPDFRGHEWYGKVLKDGQQLWAKVEGDIIRNAGINAIPRPYNSVTGLCNMPKV